MALPELTSIISLLKQHRTLLGDEWQAEVMRSWEHRYPGLVSTHELRYQIDELLSDLTDACVAHCGVGGPDVSAATPIGVRVRELSAKRAQKGFKPVDTAQYIVALKNIFTRHLVQGLSDSPAELANALRVIDDILDRLTLLTFEAYVEAREQLISQQSLTMMELSTPAILLWHNVLLLPLVGVIDTNRARQFTERLLHAISSNEAAVAIIDVTGVPVMDTSVARHIMKAVEASHLLGGRIVMTGISPEGAQTLTKLGISFANVICRASLRAGVAEALLLVGRRIVTINGDQP